MKPKIQKGMCWERRQKLVQGNVVGEQFEFVDVDRMKIVTLETVRSSYRPHRCDPNCFFRKKNPIANDAEKALAEFEKSNDGVKNQNKYEQSRLKRAVSMSRYHSMNIYKIRPCYLHACDVNTLKKRETIKGKGSYTRHMGPVYYKFISEEDIVQES